MLLGVSLVNKKLLSNVFDFFITHQCVSFDLQKICNSFFRFIFFFNFAWSSRLFSRSLRYASLSMITTELDLSFFKIILFSNSLKFQVPGYINAKGGTIILVSKWVQSNTKPCCLRTPNSLLIKHLICRYSFNKIQNSPNNLYS